MSRTVSSPSTATCARAWCFACMLMWCSLLGAAEGRAETILDTLPKAKATEVRLVMVSLEGCPFCLRWEQHVGHSYSKSAEAKFAPLVRVKFGSASLAGLAKIKFTPTFIVLKGEDEVGRIPGYPGADFFWEELGLILKKAGYQLVQRTEAQP